MNEIERNFYNALVDYYEVENFDDCFQSKNGVCAIDYQFSIGIYIADFVFYTEFEELKFVVEIDGHESHKTKEQRFNDYRRERFLQKEGYSVIRFMGSEVFVNPYGCIEEIEKIIKSFLDTINGLSDEMYAVGYYNGSTKGGKSA